MSENYVITISHHLGCGGAYIGEKLSKQLKIPFLDNQILKHVAQSLKISEQEIENREERKTSFFEAFTSLQVAINPLTPISDLYILSDKEIFNLESNRILEVSNEGSCIILGRAGNYLLKDHPNHFGIFVTASMTDRVKRVMKLYNISESEAEKLIVKNDKDRNNYMKSYTKYNWLDVRNYDISINTSTLGLDNSCEVLKNFFEQLRMVNN